jgi:hypothetical protein
MAASRVQQVHRRENPHRALGTAVLIVAVASAAAAAPIEFLVAEFPGHEVHGDSYVLVLEKSADIDHARALIEKGAAAGATIAVVRIAAGADGRNRNVRAPGEPLWSWHQTSFEGFGDAAIELCDGWPGYVEQDVDRWIANTNGTICFWSYTVVEELPEPGVALGIAMGAGSLAAAARFWRTRIGQRVSAPARSSFSVRVPRK